MNCTNTLSSHITVHAVNRTMNCTNTLSSHTTSLPFTSNLPISKSSYLTHPLLSPTLLSHPPPSPLTPSPPPSSLSPLSSHLTSPLFIPPLLPLLLSPPSPLLSPLLPSFHSPLSCPAGKSALHEFVECDGGATAIVSMQNNLTGKGRLLEELELGLGVFFVYPPNTYTP